MAACGAKGIACLACASVQTCNGSQLCAVDPNSVWKVQPFSAQITATNNGTAWDSDGSPPDVYVSMLCPGAASPTFTSQVQSYTPTWSNGGCTAKASALLSQDFTFHLGDSDVISDDVITGSLVHLATEAELVAGSYTGQATQGLLTLTFHFEKQ